MGVKSKKDDMPEKAGAGGILCPGLFCINNWLYLVERNHNICYNKRQKCFFPRPGYNAARGRADRNWKEKCT